MQFLYPSLVALTGLLVAGPLLAHLLTRRRHRDVTWAAMDFLLESHRRNQSKVRLKEWMLLALRVAVVMLAGLLAAAPISSGSLDAWFQAPETTHLVVLDDSYSMGLRHAGSTSWGEAVEALMRVMESAIDRSQAGSVVVVRYSDALRGVDPHSEPLTQQGANRLRAWLEGSTPLLTADGPSEALQTALEVAREVSDRGEPCFAYLLSDFTRHNHEEDTVAGAALEQLAELVDGLVLSPCVTPGIEPPQNLTLSEIEVGPGPFSAEVPVMLNLRIDNPGVAALEETTVKVTADGRALPTMVLEGANTNSVQRSVEVFFNEPGVHHIEVELSDDPLSADNRRWVALDLPAKREAPVYDASGDGLEGRAFASALRPRTDSRTGWDPRIERTGSIASFGGFESSPLVVLLDAPPLSAQAADELRRYVDDGGGLLIVAGPSTSVDEFNPSYTAGDQPLVPIAFGLPTQTPYSALGSGGLKASDHPLMKVFSGERGVFLPMVQVQMHHTLEGARESNHPSIEQLLTLDDGSSLLFSHTVGKGRVVVMLATTATRGEGGEPWTNLATLPIFPLLVNELAGWLASPMLQPETYEVGVEYSQDAFGRAELVAGNEPQGQSTRISLSEGAPLMEPGVYRRLSGGLESAPSAFAVNVDPKESRLDFPSSMSDVAALAPEASVLPIDDLGRARSESMRGHLAPWIGVLLLTSLAFERAMALLCSYVSPAGAKRGDR